jgi:hypothetical protein
MWSPDRLLRNARLPVELVLKNIIPVKVVTPVFRLILPTSCAVQVAICPSFVVSIPRPRALIIVGVL